MDYRQGRYADALARADEHLDWAHAHADANELFFALMWCANAAMALGMSQRAAELYEGSVAAATEVRDPRRQAMALANLGDLALIEADYERALMLSDQAAALVGGRGGSINVVPLTNGATAAFYLGRNDDARDRAVVALERSQESYLPALGPLLEVFAALAVRAGDFRRAAALLGAADAFHERTGDALEPTEEALRAQTMGEIGGLDGSLGEAWQSGFELALDDAIALALGTEPDA